jgi:hypothetical protein
MGDGKKEKNKLSKLLSKWKIGGSKSTNTTPAGPHLPKSANNPSDVAASTKPHFTKQSEHGAPLLTTDEGEFVIELRLTCSQIPNVQRESQNSRSP